MPATAKQQDRIVRPVRAEPSEVGETSRDIIDAADRTVLLNVEASDADVVVRALNAKAGIDAAIGFFDACDDDEARRVGRMLRGSTR